MQTRIEHATGLAPVVDFALFPDGGALIAAVSESARYTATCHRRRPGQRKGLGHMGAKERQQERGGTADDGRFVDQPGTLLTPHTEVDASPWAEIHARRQLPANAIEH